MRKYIIGLSVFITLMILYSSISAQGFISISDVSTSANEIAVGQTNDIKVTVQNNAGSDYNATISMVATNASGTVSGFLGLDNRSYLITGAGGTHTFTFNYSINSSVQTGIYLINISLYADNAYVESQYINISVISLVYSSFTVVYPQIADYERGEFRPLVTNNGTTNAAGTVDLDIWRIEDDSVHHYCSDSANACGTNPRKGNVTAGESTTFDLLWNVPTIVCGENDFDVTSTLTYGGTGDYWVATSSVETVMLQIDDTYTNEKIATEVVPSEVARGDEIRVQVAVSNRGGIDTTVNRVEAAIEDSNGNTISSIPLSPRIDEPTSGEDLSSNTTGATVIFGYPCSGDFYAAYFMFIGTVPSNLDLNKDYKAHVFLDYGVPREDNGIWNDDMIKDFVIVDINMSNISVTPEVGRQRNVNLTVYVKNTGFETSTIAKVKTVIKNESGDIVKIYSLENVGTIQSEETKSIGYVNWSIPMELDLGTYYVESRVDFGYSQSRTLTKYFEVVGIGIDNVLSTPTAPGESSNVTLALNNTGPTNATINTLTLSLVNSAPDVSKSISTVEVPANSVYNYTPAFYVPLTLSNSGNYTLDVTYVYGNGKTVTDTSTSFTVLPVGIKSFTVPSAGINTSSVPISITLTNIGSSNVGVFLNLTDNGSVINQTMVTAASNGDTTVNYNIDITQIGTHNITITANYTGLPQPLVRSDTIQISVTVPDLSISPSGISSSPPGPTTGQSVSITATVDNLGTGDANGVKVEFLLDGVSQANNTLSVANNSSNSTVFYWTAELGVHNITIVADPDSSITGELNETNNNATASITVTDPVTVSGGGGGGGPPPPPPTTEPAYIKSDVELTGRDIADMVYDTGDALAATKYIIHPNFASLAGVLAAHGEVVLSLETGAFLFETYEDSKSGNIIKEAPALLEAGVYELAADYALASGGADTIVISRGDIEVDSLAASTFTSLIDGRMLLVKPDRVPYPTLQALEKLRPARVYIIGGEEAISPEVEKAIGEYTFRVERIGGKDRYETSLKLAKKVQERSDTTIAVVTDGKKPAIYAASLAVRFNSPLVYVDEYSPEETSEFLKDFKVKAKIY